jgi:heme exporter protein C
MKPAFWFNVLGWAMWGVFILILRYSLERRRQASEQDAALQAIEDSLEIAK